MSKTYEFSCIKECFSMSEKTKTCCTVSSFKVKIEITKKKFLLLAIHI